MRFVQLWKLLNLRKSWEPWGKSLTSRIAEESGMAITVLPIDKQYELDDRVAPQLTSMEQLVQELCSD